MKHPFRYQAGITLVELMVGLTIGLILSLVASSIYLATSETARSAKAYTDINETGKLALDIVGREIEKAGFYPAQYPGDSANSNINGGFSNTKSSSTIYNAGIYGCDGAAYDPSTKDCGTKVTSAPDGVIINYFATQEFGSTSYLGNSNDCNRRPVTGDSANTTRAAAKLPLYVSNRYALIPTTFKDEAGNTVTVNSLACHGNGDESATTMSTQLVGVQDMVLRYGVYASATTDTTKQSPEQFLTATQVNALSTVSGLTGWQRVTAVKICVLVRSLQNSRVEDATRSYVDCRGTTQTQPVTDHTVYRRFERVYAVRNHLTGTL